MGRNLDFILVNHILQKDKVLAHIFSLVNNVFHIAGQPTPFPVSQGDYHKQLPYNPAY